MSFARNDGELMSEERLQIKRRVIFALRSRANAEVECSVLHEWCEVLRESFDNSQLDTRILHVKSCHRLRHDERAHGRPDAEADGSLSGCALRDLVLRLL